ncbi:MAG TPA: hypothetical protein PKN52_00155 [Trueperaceae bacterium]|nr:hypothetical protein [Trueperaceae bacterium]
MSMRVGPCMHEAVLIVRANPGTAILPVARAIGPHGSLMYGYNAVHRAINAGLIDAQRHGGRYSLTVSEKGVAFLQGREA